MLMMMMLERKWNLQLNLIITNTLRWAKSKSIFFANVFCIHDSIRINLDYIKYFPSYKLSQSIRGSTQSVKIHCKKCFSIKSFIPSLRRNKQQQSERWKEKDNEDIKKNFMIWQQYLWRRLNGMLIRATHLKNLKRKVFFHHINITIFSTCSFLIHNYRFFYSLSRK